MARKRSQQRRQAVRRPPTPDIAPDAPRAIQGLDRRQVHRAVATVAAARDAQQRVRQVVDELRAAGVSWHGVGWVVGTTGEAARQRFGGKRPPSQRRPRPRLKAAA